MLPSPTAAAVGGPIQRLRDASQLLSVTWHVGSTASSTPTTANSSSHSSHNSSTGWTAAPPSPFTAPYWLEAHQALLELTRNRFSAPPAGFVCKSCDGIAAAKQRSLEQQGWRVVLLSQADVEAALGGLKAGRVKVGESYDYSRLQALLRGRLEM